MKWILRVKYPRAIETEPFSYSRNAIAEHEIIGKDFANAVISAAQALHVYELRYNGAEIIGLTHVEE